MAHTPRLIANHMLDIHVTSRVSLVHPSAAKGVKALSPLTAFALLAILKLLRATVSPGMLCSRTCPHSFAGTTVSPPSLDTCEGHAKQRL